MSFKNIGVTMNKIFITLFMFIIYSCSSLTLIKKNRTYPIKEFYYDENNYSLIRLFQFSNDSTLIKKYNNWISNHPYKSYEFYKKEILKLSENYIDKIKDIDKSKVTQKPKLLSLPKPKFPKNKKMIGNFLKVVVTVTVDTLGNAEFVTLYNIYRTKNSFNQNKCKLPWICTKKYDIDKPYIKAAIFAAQKIKFLPFIYDHKKYKVTINIPYSFVLK